MNDMEKATRAEIALHKSDMLYGSPLEIGNGFTIAMHAGDCPRCAWLIHQAILAAQGKETI